MNRQATSLHHTVGSVMGNWASSAAIHQSARCTSVYVSARKRTQPHPSDHSNKRRLCLPGRGTPISLFPPQNGPFRYEGDYLHLEEAPAVGATGSSAASILSGLGSAAKWQPPAPRPSKGGTERAGGEKMWIHEHPAAAERLGAPELGAFPALTNVCPTSAGAGRPERLRGGHTTGCTQRRGSGATQHARADGPPRSTRARPPGCSCGASASKRPGREYVIYTARNIWKDWSTKGEKEQTDRQHFKKLFLFNCLNRLDSV